MVDAVDNKIWFKTDF